MEFTGVELTGGAELVALVDKATTDPHALEGRSGREARWRGGKTGYCALARWRCRLAEQRGRGDGGTVESAVTEAARACGGNT